MTACNPPKLSLFALPSQTSLLFFVIATIVGTPLILSSSRDSFLLLPVLPFGVALLTLWDFLRQPDVQRRRWRMEPLSSEHDWLQSRVARLAAEAGLAQAPCLLVAHEGLSAPLAFGTWRRRYLAFPDWMIAEMAAARNRVHSDDIMAVETIVRHELGHFVNGDIWLTFLSRSLLKMTVIFLLANWFAMIWTPFLYEALRQELADLTTIMPSILLDPLPPEVRDVLQEPPALSSTDILVYVQMVSGALLPLLVGSFLLWRHTWNALLQVRELYCDARVASWLHSAQPIGLAMRWFGAVSAVPIGPDRPSLWQRLRGRLNPKSSPQPLAWPGAPPWGRWFSPQPEARTRHQALARPERVYGSSKRVGLRAGAAVLLLYLVSASIFAPGGKGVNSGPVFGLGFVMLALGLMPLAIVLGDDWRAAVRHVVRAVSFYALVFGTAMAVMLTLAVLALAVMPRSLDVTMYAIAMVLPRGDLQVVVEAPDAWLWQAVVGAAITFLIGLPALLFTFLVADLAIKRRLLTWYGAGFMARRHKLVLLAATTVLTVLLWFGAVPLLNLIALPGIFEPDAVFWLQMSLAGLLAVAATAVFAVLHLRYAHRCPHCKAKVDGNYILSKRCPQCSTSLNPWLVASY